MFISPSGSYLCSRKDFYLLLLCLEKQNIPIIIKMSKGAPKNNNLNTTAITAIVMIMGIKIAIKGSASRPIAIPVITNSPVKIRIIKVIIKKYLHF